MPSGADAIRDDGYCLSVAIIGRPGRCSLELEPRAACRDCQSFRLLALAGIAVVSDVKATSRATADATRAASGTSIDGSALNDRSGVGKSYHCRATGRRDWPKTLTSRRTRVWRTPCSRSVGSFIRSQERSTHHHRRESRENSPGRYLVGCRGRPHVSRPALFGPGLSWLRALPHHALTGRRSSR